MLNDIIKDGGKSRFDGRFTERFDLVNISLTINTMSIGESFVFLYMKNFVCIISILLLTVPGFTQFVPNYDESKVPDYELPDILKATQGKTEWETERRKEILQLFEEHVYGKTELGGVKTSFTVVEENRNALCGKAVMKEIVCKLERNGKTHNFSILLFTPSKSEKAPVFVGLNFYGNHTVHYNKSIDISDKWVGNKAEFMIFNNKADERSRGVRAYRWPVEQIIDIGYGIATIYAGDIDPDFDDGFKNGIHSILDETSMATVGAWAAGLSKAMDYFETDADVDEANIAVFGHSRLGKAALWAAAQDERFKAVISNESGCGGAALSKRQFGETVRRINSSFPHWFAGKFKDYNENEEALPVDQHMLISLIAPRAVYVGSAQGDQWADPRGEYLSLKLADKIYEIYGEERLPLESPDVNKSQQIGKRGYHIRSGKHEVTRLDWLHYLDFADKWLK